MKKICNKHIYKNEPHNLKIGVIGGGIGGCMAALRLSEEFPNTEIVLFEKNKKLLEGTSNCTPGRMGLGFHYIDKNTAKLYLRLTIEFSRYFYKSCPHLMIGQEYSRNHPLRNGRYFIVKNSSFSRDAILETYRELTKEYAKLIEIDKENKIFGEPKDFFRILDPEEYKEDICIDRVDLGIETREHLLDWIEFRKFITERIEERKNINIVTDSEVCDISFSYTSATYSLHIKNPDKVMIEKEINFIINATWEWVDYMNSKIGYYRLPSEVRTNRAKIIVKISLPEELKEKNSMFFCMGPFCMFSNLGGGVGFITYAPVTNVLNSTDLIPNKDYLNLINGKLEISKQEELAEAVINGVAQYIPAMRNANVKQIFFGTVQIEGKADIFDPASKVHKRDYMGLKYLEYGFISLSCMKLLYGHASANEIAMLFKTYMQEIYPARMQIKSLISTELSLINSEKEININIMSGICFVGFIRSGPINDAFLCGIPLEEIYLNFCNKINLNKEVKSSYQLKKFHDKRRNNMGLRIKEAFSLEKPECVVKRVRVNNALLDKFWLWFNNYNEVKAIDFQYKEERCKFNCYFFKKFPNSTQIIEYVSLHTNYSL